MPAGTDAGVMDAKGAVATHVCTSKSSATNFAADAPPHTSIVAYLDVVTCGST